MRNLNNFPDDLFELSGKRLMAMAVGFVVFGGTLGAIFAQKLIRRDILANQISHQRYLDNPPPLTTPAASTEAVAKEWHYSTAYGPGGGGIDSYDLTGNTADDYRTVWKHYADKIDYASMVARAKISPTVETNASVGHGDNEITRGVQNRYDQEVRYSVFSREDQNHLIRVTLTPLKTGTFVSTFVYRKTH